MNVMRDGGSINADFQCSVAHSHGYLGDEPILVMNSCKDGIPSMTWVCVCLPGLRYFHVNVSWFGIPTKVRSPKDLRDHMAYALTKTCDFENSEALWAYARKKDLPRILHEESCRRFGIEISADDLAFNAQVLDKVKHAPCRALA